jgi:uncharacterized tellurite resistance protein B-like protein
MMSGKVESLSTLMRGAKERAGDLSRQVGSSLQDRIKSAGVQTAPVLSSLKENSKTLLRRLTPKEALQQRLPDLTEITDEQRLAYYGAMIAMAATDGSMDREELTLLLDIFEADAMDKSKLAQLKGYFVEPPELAECLAVLGDSEEEFRFGLTFQLVEIAFADDIIRPEEREALEEAARLLQVSVEQLDAIEAFVKEARRLEARGENDKIATECLKQAASGLASVGVPITAVYFSGSVIGLSAAGITSGLAALGLGFGMVPGIAAAVVLGTGTYFGLGRILDIGGHRRRELENAETERRAQLVIAHLQEALNELMERVATLQSAATTAQQNKQELLLLKDRMRTLQSIIAKKRMVLSEEC